jgi:porin
MVFFMILRLLASLSLIGSSFANQSEIAACCPSQNNVDQMPLGSAHPKGNRTPQPSSSGSAGSATSSPPVLHPPSPIDPGALFDSDWHLKLLEKGISTAASYYVEFVGNPVGGKEHGFGNAASLGVALGFDLDKLINAHGLSFFSSAIFRTGRNLSAQKIDNQFPVTQLYGGETVRLNELYFKETLFNGDMHIKAGRLTGGNDFLSSPFYCEFISNAICGNPISIFFNAPFLAYPFSTWGAYLDFKLYKNFLFKFAAFNDNLSIKENKYHGCNFTFKSTTGVLWMTEWLYLLNQLPTDTGNKGNYKIGGYYQSGKFNLFEGGHHKGNYGLYLLFDQMLYRKNGPGTTQGLTMFGSFLFAPPDRNMFPYFVDFGLIYKGIFTGRNKDYLSLGIANGNYSPDLRHEQKKSKRTGVASVFGDQPQSAETVIELNYWYRFNKWFAVTPGLQYVINPKGYGNIQNALVFETQISIDLIGLPMQP